MTRGVKLGAAILGAFVLLALVGPFLVGDPTVPVGAPHQPPSASHWLGTTGQGQDVLAQTVAGARSTLLVGFLVGAVVVAIGALVGATAGYLGGKADAALSLVVNVFLLLPGLPLAVVLAAFLPGGASTMALVLVVTGWAWHARVLRAQTLALARRDFVLAAEVGGEPRWRIITGEILPLLAPLIASSFVGATLYAIGAQVGLEFLGLGDASQVTWGTNLYWASNDSALLTGAWWMFGPTGLSVALVGFALGLVGTAFDQKVTHA